MDGWTGGRTDGRTDGRTTTTTFVLPACLPACLLCCQPTNCKQTDLVKLATAFSVRALKAAHSRRRFDALVAASDEAGEEAKQHEESYENAKKELKELEKKKDDSKFDIFVDECALYVRCCAFVGRYNTHACIQYPLSLLLYVACVAWRGLLRGYVCTCAQYPFRVPR